MKSFHMKKKVYRTKRFPFFLKWIISFIGLSIFVNVLGILTLKETLNTKLDTFMNVEILLICFVIISIFTVTNRLEVSSEGVTYYEMGFRIYTPWHNIVGVTPIKHPISSLHITTVFTFRQPALLNVSIEEGKRQGLAVIEKYWLMRCLAAPPITYLWYSPLPRTLVSPFDLEQGELSMYIRQYAPSLLNR